jgi:hypothetical protein
MAYKEPAPFAKRMGCERPRISARRRHKTFHLTKGAYKELAVDDVPV